MTLLRRAVFPVALAAVVLVHLLVAVPSLIELRLWEDEAFNLTVPLNLLRGLGYTSDGTLSGSELTPFDPRISTGPVVLLPVAATLATGADIVLAGRGVMLVFYAALLVGLWVVGRRIGGRWAGLVAVTVPLALDTNAPPSPLQGPADILGEIPAAAFLVFALATLRSRPWLAGLILGLAVQCKTIALLAAPALVLAVFLTEPGQTLRQRLRRVLPMLGMALVPTALFELWKLAALGPVDYVQNARHFVGFLLSGGQSVGRVPPLGKFAALLSAWQLPLAATALIIVGALVVCICAVIVLRRGAGLPGAVAGAGARSTGAEAGSIGAVAVTGAGSTGAGAGPTSAVSERMPRRDLLVLLGASALGLLTWIAWWFASSHTPVWIRHPSPGLFTFVPVLAAYVVLALHVLAGVQRVWMRVVSAVGAAALAAVMVLQAAAHVTDALTSPSETLADQRRAAAEIAELHEERLAGVWGSSVSVTVMSGAHAALTDAPDVDDVTRIWVGYDQSEAGQAAFDERLQSVCGPELLVTGSYVVCEAP